MMLMMQNVNSDIKREILSLTVERQILKSPSSVICPSVLWPKLFFNILIIQEHCLADLPTEPKKLVSFNNSSKLLLQSGMNLVTELFQ